MKRTSPSRNPGELALIEAIRRQAASAPQPASLRLGIGDDCAILRPKPGHEICVTTDFTLEGVHFRRDWHPPASVGHRCLARGLSDLAAMGARPIAVFLSIALPEQLPSRWLDGFLRGFLDLAALHRAPMAGGDTAASVSGRIAADIVAIGEVPSGTALLRSSARPGDAIYVTGYLGGAAAELRQLSRSPRRFSRAMQASPEHPHLYPDPRLAVGRRLRRLAANAAIDVSDGLSTDLTHLCEESGVAAVLEEALLPIHPLARESPDALQLALNGGEDYELLFTVRPTQRIPRSIAGVPLRRIGTIGRRRAGQPLILLKTIDNRSLPIRAAGWQHFVRKR
ncbi:MAG TPA: thiamine-phosphate kinase [Acidobacteriaceae bacterium]|jgi:thiamine-monophosphate kinase|nr:thiamine-phosphate kinase [Acidobacteriaceae bacterium]